MIAERLVGFARDQRLAIGLTGHLDVAEAQEARACFLVHANAVHTRFALRFRSSVKLLKALCALDGCAEQILLISASTNEDETTRQLDISNTQVMLTDTDFSSDTVDAQMLETYCSSLKARGGTPNAVQMETQYLLATSGTTALPKIVSHTLASLTRTSVLPNDPSHHVRWALVYDHARFAGFQVLLQALLSGGCLIAPELECGLPEALDFLSTHEATHFSATPTMWRKVLMLPESTGLAPKQITLGGEIADENILRALAKRYPAARIVHIFASTEAGVGFSVKDGKPGFPVSYLAAPPNGVRLKVESGRLFIHNTQVSPSYRGGDNRFADEDGFIDTGDLVVVEDDRIFFLGRSNGVINVGGNKVTPERIEAYINSFPGVLMSRVYPKKSPMMGSVIAADVVAHCPEIEQLAFKKQLLSHCRKGLERYEIPLSLKIVDAISVNSGGKIVRS